MTLVDSNILIDVLFHDRIWFDWSTSRLGERAFAGPLFINDIIFTEIALGFSTGKQVEEALAPLGVERRPFGTEALFMAASAFQTYRRNSGVKTNVLPDFFIGAQAQAENLAVLTRDVRRYRTYFPTVRLITP